MANDIGEVIFEFTQVGSIVKVVAVHAATGREAVIQGPAYRSQKALRDAALAKLRFLLEKDRKEGRI